MSAIIPSEKTRRLLMSPVRFLPLLTGMVVGCVVSVDSLNQQNDTGAAAQLQTVVEKPGTVTIPAHSVPLSVYMSEEARQRFVENRNWPQQLVVTDQGIEEYRDGMDRHYFAPRLRRARELYPVVIEEGNLAGVRVDIVLPAEGVPSKNRRRLLINLHGGGFSIGAGLGGLIESVPLAHLGKMQVISIHYRQGPEHEYPAATEDVAAVYDALLKEYKPEHIGIYGCSAGGILTAMTVAWLQKEKQPRPGAIGIFCAGADAIIGGDSRFFASPLSGNPPLPAAPNPPPTRMPYLPADSSYDPLVSPVFSPLVLAKFPPVLLISGTRDDALSAVVHTHSNLVKVGVEADLHVWDGMWHGFIYDTDLPESREAFEVMVKFFDHHLRSIT